METGLKDVKIKSLCKLYKFGETVWYAKHLLEGDSGRICSESGYDMLQQVLPET